MRYAAIFGDVHGENKQLIKLIAEIRSRYGYDGDLYSVGDLVDRGEDPKSVIQTCVDEDVKGILGNHEQWLQDLILSFEFDEFVLSKAMAGIQTINSYGVKTDGRKAKDIATELYKKIPESHKAWLSSLVGYRCLEFDNINYWLIHAGLTEASANNFKEWSTSDMALLEKMDSTTRGRNCLLWPTPIFGDSIQDNLFQFENGTQIFGHKPTQKIVLKKKYIALDTGCGTCYPYSLSAVILPNLETISIGPSESWV